MATEKLIHPPAHSEQAHYAYPGQPTGWSIEKLSPANRQEWDEFVRSSPDGLPTQLAAWEGIMSASYGYPCHFLLARRVGAVEGVLPLFLVDSFLTGRRLDSMPGAACAACPEAANILIEAADRLASELKINYLLLRDSRQLWPGTNLEVVESHRGIKRSLNLDIEKTWKELPRDIRREIRNGQKQADLQIQIDATGLEDFYRFYNHYNQKVGTPLFGYNFIKQIANCLPNSYQITKLYNQGKMVGGFFNLTMGNSIFGMWGGSFHEYLKLKPNHRAYWSMIQTGSQDGYTQYDIGRSEYPSSQYDFKRKWGDQVFPIFQLYRIYQGNRPSLLEIRNSQNQSISISIFRAIWKRFPEPAVRRLGPHIRRHLPFG